MFKFDYPVGFTFIALVLSCFGAGFFVGSSSIGLALNGFMLSIFSSYVFFFLTVTLKESSEKRKIKNIVDPMIIDIIRSLYDAINNSIFVPKNIHKSLSEISNLEEIEMYKLLDMEKLNIPMKGWRLYYYEFKAKPETYIDQLILDSTLPIESILDQMKSYYFMLDHDLVEKLTAIERASYLKLCGNYLKYENKFRFDISSFIEFYKLINKLEVHVDLKLDQNQKTDV